MAKLYQEIPESSESQAALEREQEQLHRALRDSEALALTKQGVDGLIETAKSEATDRTALEVTRGQVATGNKFQGDIGEQQAAAIAVQKLDLVGVADFAPGWQGLDGVYSDHDHRIVVLEAKFTDEPISRALSATKHGTQMSPEWIQHNAERMRRSDSVLYTPGNARVGVQILDAAPEDLRRITVLIHPGTLEASAYEGSPDGQWHLIQRWSALDIDPSV